MKDYNYHEQFALNPKLHFDAIVGGCLLGRATHKEKIPLVQLEYLAKRLEQEGYTAELAKKASEILI
jgi:hypothetical protein